MKEIISNFVERYQNVDFIANCSEIEDLDVEITTYLERNHLILSNYSKNLHIIRRGHILASYFDESTEHLEFEDVVYLHEPIVDTNQFIVIINLKTRDFTTVGRVRRSQILETLNRLSTVIDALKFYDSKKSIDTKVLTDTYPWFDFCWRGIDLKALTIEARSHEVYGFFRIDQTGLLEINCSLSKSTIRLMKRHLPKKVRRRKSKYSDHLSEFERLIINAKTGPVKILHRQLESRKEI